ncbi:MAG: hypothetical protein QMB92_03870, partial [Thiopseudomonas sp.]
CRVSDSSLCVAIPSSSRSEAESQDPGLTAAFNTLNTERRERREAVEFHRAVAGGVGIRAARHTTDTDQNGIHKSLFIVFSNMRFFL